MSACISSHGEYSEHTPDAEWTCTLCGDMDTAGLRAEVKRLRHENADLRRSRDERKATERRRRTEDREAWMRAQEAEVRADERAKVLAGFTEETRTNYRLKPCDCPDADPEWRKHNPHIDYANPLEERRLVGPWEPTP